MRDHSEQLILESYQKGTPLARFTASGPRPLVGLNGAGMKKQIDWATLKRTPCYHAGLFA